MQSLIGFALLFTTISGFATAADQIKLADCQSGDLRFQVFSNSGSDVLVIEDNKGLSPKLVSATYQTTAAGGIDIKFPKFWPTESLSEKECQLVTPAPTPVFSVLNNGKEAWIEANVDGFWIDAASYDEATSNDKIDQLVKDCKAFPIQFTILCFTSTTGTDMQLCSKFRVKDTIIPVNFRCP